MDVLPQQPGLRRSLSTPTPRRSLRRVKASIYDWKLKEAHSFQHNGERYELPRRAETFAAIESRLEERKVPSQSIWDRKLSVTPEEVVEDEDERHPPRHSGSLESCIPETLRRAGPVRRINPSPPTPVEAFPQEASPSPTDDSDDDFIDPRSPADYRSDFEEQLKGRPAVHTPPQTEYDPPQPLVIDTKFAVETGVYSPPNTPQSISETISEEAETREEPRTVLVEPELPLTAPDTPRTTSELGHGEDEDEDEDEDEGGEEDEGENNEASKSADTLPSTVQAVVEEPPKRPDTPVKIVEEPPLPPDFSTPPRAAAASPPPPPPPPSPFPILKRPVTPEAPLPEEVISCEPAPLPEDIIERAEKKSIEKPKTIIEKRGLNIPKCPATPPPPPIVESFFDNEVAKKSQSEPIVEEGSVGVEEQLKNTEQALVKPFNHAQHLRNLALHRRRQQMQPHCQHVFMFPPQTYGRKVNPWLCCIRCGKKKLRQAWQDNASLVLSGRRAPNGGGSGGLVEEAAWRNHREEIFWVETFYDGDRVWGRWEMEEIHWGEKVKRLRIPNMEEQERMAKPRRGPWKL